MITPSIINTDNNTTDNDTVNLTTNNTTDEAHNQTTTQTNTQKTTQKEKTSAKSNEVTYDEQLNVYFDKNGKTAYDGQFPKETSKEQLQEYSKASLE